MASLKRRHFQQREVPKQLLFEDGIPRLRRTISETGPSVPTENEHPAVSFEEKNFGLLSGEVFDLVKNDMSGLQTVQGCVTYASENDVANRVHNVVFNVLGALGFSTLASVHSEVATFNIRPDILVVEVRRIPIGVIEVKKPDKDSKIVGMQHPNILGELFDFMEHLPNFYGVTPVFGVLTNLAEWRVAWLPSEEADNIASQVATFEDEDDMTVENEVAENEKAENDEKGSEEKEEADLGIRPTATKTNPIVHALEEAEEEEEEEEEVIPAGRRHLHVSRVFRGADADHEAMRALFSVMYKMCRYSKPCPFHDPFDKLDERTLLRFTRGAGDVIWTRLPGVTGKWNKVARSDVIRLFAIEDLGRGANGRVWLTCTSSGAVCVLKYSIEKKPDRALAGEYKNWTKAYPQMKVYLETWCGHTALRMPHFATISPDQRTTKLGLVEEALRTHFLGNGLVHEDVYWRNIGIYRQGRQEHVVLYDMASVREARVGEGDHWVRQCLQNLQA